MADCSNVEIRELLPERAGGALSVVDTARVDAHLGSCEMCTSELALIQTVRRALRVSPAIDVTRIATVVIAKTAAPSRPQLVGSGARAAAIRRRPALRWVGWKAAAAIAIAAAGAGSFAVWSSANESGALPNGSVATTQAELGVAGGLTDLSDGDLQALLGDLGAANGGAVADASFEEPEVMVPSVGTTSDEGSI